MAFNGYKKVCNWSQTNSRIESERKERKIANIKGVPKIQVLFQENLKWLGM